MSIPKPPYAEGQEFTNDVTGVTYKFDGVKWIAVGSGEEIDLSGYVRKEGGDSMEGPLNMRPQAGADVRQTNRVQTLGVYSNSAASSLRLGTDRDRIYVGSNDTSFNGPIKVDELQEKVWSYQSDIETHTVETHIYRLRKKINDKFSDGNFIVNTKDGYSL